MHGLHYLGDKLSAITRMAKWLKPDGLLVANFEAASIRDHNGKPVNLMPALKAAGFTYDARTKRIRKRGPETTPFEWKYLGADKNAGPNYTGQPAVRSYYQIQG
ncbi:class I SAM-dependent methyltransferase [Kibdelosporangium philippinense]|uniref:Class I SAM-dependent methyltransferase n=1 Tax=Kibdelosporangium philippinense TaxID=211113 RepID=A0ABS8ZT67_9PSEU|nr:class I SAM-dependent methyltransferase [Kibdelosporangium philippinense]MCE7010792.1 class I SAM-dependent methyltransferase [Kibdelosporangium philippinense]